MVKQGVRVMLLAQHRQHIQLRLVTQPQQLRPLILQVRIIQLLQLRQHIQLLQTIQLLLLTLLIQLVVIMLSGLGC